MTETSGPEQHSRTVFHRPIPPKGTMGKLYGLIFLDFLDFWILIKSFKIMSYMACMEDLLLQKGCLNAYATFCLCGFLKDLIYELILFAFMYFHVLDLYFCVLGLYLVSWTCILGLWTCIGCLSSIGCLIMGCAM